MTNYQQFYKPKKDSQLTNYLLWYKEHDKNKKIDYAGICKKQYAKP